MVVYARQLIRVQREGLDPVVGRPAKLTFACGLCFKRKCIKIYVYHV